MIEQILATHTTTPTLWWLGHSGFAVKFSNILYLVDPVLSELDGRSRTIPVPFPPEHMTGADLVLCTHAHAAHMDPATLRPLLDASPHVKIVLPKSAAETARAAGIPYDRMTTTDAGLRVEFFKDGLYGRVYAVPSAHAELDYTPLGGYPYLGYLIRFEQTTIYHAGDCVLYPDLAARLRPYNVTVALLPIEGPNFSPVEAAQLAADIGARWVVPMHYGTFSSDQTAINRFIEHLLGHRPEQKFKVFACGEKWTIPA